MRVLWLLAASGVVAVLCWTLYSRFAAGRIKAIGDKRRSTSKIVSNGEFVDGNRHLNVVLALTDTDLFYENSDMQASLDLRWVREIEYDSRLTTGNVVEGMQVLRLRCASQLFEFVLPGDVVPAWRQVLPPRSSVTSAARAADAGPVAVAS